jgi:hypothetical protein
MRKIARILILLLFAAPAFAQVDIVSPWKGPFGDLGRNLLWGVSGAGGMNNAFIINLPGPQIGGCLFVRNLNPAAGHAFTLRAFVTNDQQATGYYSTPGAVWTPINVTASQINPGATANQFVVQVAGSAIGMTVFSVAPAGGAKIAFVIADSIVQAGIDTANVFYTFGSPSPCSAYIPPNTQIFFDSRVGLATPGTVNIAWVGLNAIYPGAPQTWKACSFYLRGVLTGAAGTLNTYIDSYDSVTTVQDDRISFLQLAATGNQAAQINFENPAVPHTATVNTLAAGTIVTGIMSDTMRVSYVLTGVGCTFNALLTAICH